LLSLQSLPIYIFKPRMRHDLVRPIISQSVLWFTLNQLIHKVNSLLGPIIRNIFFPNLNLFCQNFISDLLPVRSYIGPKPENALKNNDSECIVIYSYSMVASAHHLRCHIARSSWGIAWILRFPNTSNSQISYSYIAFSIKDKILWL